MKVDIHYPRDAIKYMTGHCGSSSLSSSIDLEIVTCLRCKEKLLIEAEINLKFVKKTAP